jgi:hypothetical protein
MLKRIALASIAAALIGATGAVAHTTSFASNVSFEFFECIDCNGGVPTKGNELHTYVTGGQVTSPKAECVPNRKVKLYAVYAIPRRGAATKELLDVDRTSNNGAWSGRFTHDLLGVDHLQAKLVRKNIGPSGHRHICDGDSDTHPFA